MHGLVWFGGEWGSVLVCCEYVEGVEVDAWLIDEGGGGG